MIYSMYKQFLFSSTEESAARKARPNKDSKGLVQAVPPAVSQDGAALVGGTVSPTTLISAAFLNMRTVSALSMQHLVNDSGPYCIATSYHVTIMPPPYNFIPHHLLQISEQYAQATRSLSARRMRRSYKAGLGYGGSNCSLFLTYSLLFWYGSSLVKSGQVQYLRYRYLQYNTLCIAHFASLFGQ